MDEAPKKISAEQVEVLGANGEVVKPSKEKSRNEASFQTGFGSMKVMKVSPWMLLFIPIVIPVLIIGFFLMMILALLFGRTMFKVLRNPMVRR